MRFIVMFVSVLLTFSPNTWAAGEFEGVWSWEVIDKRDDTRSWSHGLTLVQHGDVVCGEWSSSSPRQLFSGYFAGRLVKGGLKAYTCDDNGQPSEFVCPKFDPAPHLLRRVRGGLLWTPPPDSVLPRSVNLKRTARPILFQGDESTTNMLLSCKLGSNIPMQRTELAPIKWTR
jgi:hypothetical protein